MVRDEENPNHQQQIPAQYNVDHPKASFEHVRIGDSPTITLGLQLKT